jgi:hemolysin III
MSRLLSTSICLAMGWALFPYLKLARILTHRAVWPGLLGGQFYANETVLNHLHWPGLWSGVFSAHELWHLYVMAGSTSHFWLMLTVVVPFAPRARDVL